MDFKAVIFDMNGVIIVDEHIQQQAWKKSLAENNFAISDEDYHKKVAGRTEKAVLENLYNRSISEEELAHFSDKRLDYAIELYKPQMKLTEGLKTFLDDLKAKNIPLGVATSNRRKYVDFIMDGLDIRHYFDVIMTAQDIVNGKPDPEIYLKTAEKLHIEPHYCIVIEDSLSGLQAGKAAGMYVIGITTTHKKEELSTADYVIDSFHDLSVQKLKEL